MTIAIENAASRLAATAGTYAPAGVRLEGERPRLLLLDAQAESAVNSRGAFIQALVRKGYAVTVAAPDFNPEVANRLAMMGARFCRIPFKPTGMNPLATALSIYRIYTVIRMLRPDFFIGVTIKPSSLGVIAAWLAGVPNRFALLTGLGYAFTEGREIKRRIANFAVRFLFKLALVHTKATIFQNDDDKRLFTTTGLLEESKAARVNGSGVDLAKFAPAAFPSTPFTFLMVGRLLEDKGVREYVAAARIIKRAHPEARFLLVGARDQNPTAVTEAELKIWVADGVIEYGGTVADVRPAIAACHVFVLPSYREGVPKAVLEALAMGRPVITTHTPGCRETVLDGANGILVPVKDVDALASAALRLIASQRSLGSYGAESRALAERKFDVNIVIAQLLAILDHNSELDSVRLTERDHGVLPVSAS